MVCISGRSVSPLSLVEQQTFTFFFSRYFYYSLLLFSLVFSLNDVCYFHFPFFSVYPHTKPHMVHAVCVLCTLHIPPSLVARLNNRARIAWTREQNFRYEIKIDTKGRRQECGISYLLLWRMNRRLQYYFSIGFFFLCLPISYCHCSVQHRRLKMFLNSTYSYSRWQRRHRRQRQHTLLYYYSVWYIQSIESENAFCSAFHLPMFGNSLHRLYAGALALPMGYCCWVGCWHSRLSHLIT